MKYGFDVHGVLDTYPAMCEMATTLHQAGHEVWIITGLKHTMKSQLLMSDLNVEWDYWYSIVDDLENQGEEVEWRDGLPYADAKKWNEAKALFCQRVGIDVLFDDSPKYMEVFKELGVDTLYNFVHNTKRIQYQTRG